MVRNKKGIVEKTNDKIKLRVIAERTPSAPNWGTEINREIIRFFVPIRKISKITKFLCSANKICLKAADGSSMIICIVFQRSIFTTLSLK
jgi:hypothetical protein